MIDWDKTHELYGIREPRYRKRLAVICDNCGASGSIVLTRVSDVVSRQMPWRCAGCGHEATNAKLERLYSDPNLRAAVSESSKKKWEDPKYRQKVLEAKSAIVDQTSAKISDTMKANWADPELRAKWEAAANSEETRAKLSIISKAQWEDPEYRASMIELFKTRGAALWQNEDYRNKVVSALRGNQRLSELLKARWKDPEYARRMSSLHKYLWAQPDYRAKMLEIISSNSNTPEFKTKMRAISLMCWRDPEYRNNQIEKLSANMSARWQNPEFKERMGRLQQSIEYKQAISEAAKSIWSDPEYRNKMATVRAAQPRVSSLQTTLYSILDDLGVKYYREYPDKAADPECSVGPYNFDCVIPRPNKPTLLVECQGEYWHSLKGSIARDQSKASYIANNLSGQYELKAIWEHEFLNQDKVVELLKYWLGITAMETADFSFTDVEIRPCPADEYRLLLSKYHYLPTAGRGGLAYGAYLGSILVGVCIFSPLIRQNIQIDDFKSGEVRELSRLCIHPKYQKKNFASWFVSRCVKLLPMQHRCVISYCDTTFNHTGAIYKAANFLQDAEVPPDYWYVSVDGWVMHKRTLYGHARLMKMKETEYADLHGYFRVYGDKKLRFKFVR